MNRLLAICVLCTLLFAAGCASPIRSLPHSADDIVFDSSSSEQEIAFDFEEYAGFPGVSIADAYSSVIAALNELRYSNMYVSRARYPSVILAEERFNIWGDSLKNNRAYGIYLKSVRGGVQIKVLVKGKKGIDNLESGFVFEHITTSVANGLQPSIKYPVSARVAKEFDDEFTAPDAFPSSIAEVSFDPDSQGKKGPFGLHSYEEIADFPSTDIRAVFLAAINSVELHGFIVQKGNYASVIIAREPLAPADTGPAASAIYIREFADGIQAKIITSGGGFGNKRNARNIITGIRSYLLTDSQTTDDRHRYFMD